MDSSNRRDRLEFADRVVIVTGASSGLGRAYAEGFAARGARVLVNGRDEVRVAETVERLRAEGGTALACVADVTDEGAAERIVGAATEAWGRVDALVNNAGVGHMGSIASVTPRDLELDRRKGLVGAVQDDHAVVTGSDPPSKIPLDPCLCIIHL